MKSVLMAFLLFMLSVSVQAQQDRAAISEDEYRKKAKTNKKTGVVMAVTGTILLIGTNIYAFSQVMKSNPDLRLPMYASVVLLTGSLPFFIISQKQLKKAKAVSTSWIIDRYPVVTNGSINQSCFTGLSVKISL